MFVSVDALLFSFSYFTILLSKTGVYYSGLMAITTKGGLVGGWGLTFLAFWMDAVGLVNGFG